MNGYRVRLFTVLGVCVAAVAISAMPPGGPKAYRAVRIWTAIGEPIDDAVLVVERSKVVAVGKHGEVKLPPGTELIELRDAVIIPGLVIAQTSLAERGQDDEHAITPEVRAIDGFDLYDDFSRIVAGGVTTVQLSPGSRRLMPGQGAVVKLAGSDPVGRVLAPAESLRVLLGDAAKNPPKIFEPPVPPSSTENPIVPAKPQLPSSRAGAVAAVRATLRAAETYRKNRAANSPRSLPLEAVLRYMGNGRTVRFTAAEAVDVRAAMNLAKEFGLRVTLVDPVEPHHFNDQYADWAKAGTGVILNAEVRPGRVWNEPVRSKDSPERRPVWQNARELLAAGVRVAIRPADDGDLGDMLFIGGVFAHAGIAPGDVLRMLTAHSAEILGVADRVGSLVPGRDADFVVLTDDPLATHATVREVYVAGERVFQSGAARNVTIVRAATVYPGTGPPIARGTVLVEGSKIRAVGADVSAPPRATVMRYDAAVIVPGFIDLSSQLGLSAAAGSTQLQTKLGDLFVAGDPAIAAARQGGVTTALFVPSAAGPAPVLAFKLGDTPRVIREPVAIKFTVSGNLTATVASLRSTLQRGKSYADSWTRYDKELAEYEQKRKEYEAAKTKAEAEKKKAEPKKEEPKKEAEPKKDVEPKKDAEPKKEPEAKKEGEPKKDADAKKEGEPKQPPAKPDASLPPEPKPPTKPSTDAAMEPYRPLFAGQIPALVEAVRADAIRSAVGLFRDEFNVRVVLLRAEDAFRTPELLASKQVAVAVGPELVRVVDNAPVNLAQTLATHQARFGFASGGTTGSKYLPLAVTYAVRQGLGTHDALSGLTTWPAEMLGLQNQIGGLAPGRDADLVLWSGPPFELSSRVLAVMIDGEWVYRAEGVR